jgi:hypothetical protein
MLWVTTTLKKVTYHNQDFQRRVLLRLQYCHLDFRLAVVHPNCQLGEPEHRHHLQLDHQLVGTAGHPLEGRHDQENENENGNGQPLSNQNTNASNQPINNFVCGGSAVIQFSTFYDCMQRADKLRPPTHRRPAGVRVQVPGTITKGHLTPTSRTDMT